MALDHPLQLRDRRLLDIAVYLSLFLLLSIGFVLSADWFTRVVIAVLCLAFALVHHFGFAAVHGFKQAHLYFAVQTIIVTALCMMAGSGDPFNFPFFILSIQAMLVFRTRIAVVWIVLFYVVGCLTVGLRTGGVNPVYLLFYLATYIFVAVFGYTLRQVEIARRQNEKLLDELSVAQQRLQALAVAEERNRLARDLHDSTKQQAFALSAQLAAARTHLRRDSDAAERHLHQAEQMADTLREELAALILDLRPPALDRHGFDQALCRYVNEWSEQHKISTTVHIATQNFRLSPETENVLFRIAQEALANIVRHSQAKNVEVRMNAASGHVTLTIIDDGRGFDLHHAPSGLGLHSMRERAIALPEGALAIDTAPGAGTRVTVHCRT